VAVTERIFGRWAAIAVHSDPSRLAYRWPVDVPK
jgi:hypothetical protein